MTVACVVASALAFAGSGGAANFFPLAWIAPFPILWLALHVTSRRAAIAAFIAYALGRLGTLPILLATLPVGVDVLVIVSTSAAFAGLVVLARAVAERVDLRLYALAFPLFWVSWEKLIIMPIGAGAELGFTQADAPAVIQLAAFTGVVGVSFIVTFAGALAATALTLRERQRPWRPLAFAGTGALLAVLLLGILRLAFAPQSNDIVHAGVAVSDQMVGRFRTERADEAMEVIDAYVARTHDLATHGAQVVVLPEKFVGVTPAYAAAVDERFARAAAADGVWIVAGLNLIGRMPPRNVAAVFAPDGTKVLEYDKIHLVPRYEDAYASGEQIGLLPTAPGPWAVAVCRDLNLADIGSRLARSGAKMVFAPAWDFGPDGALESRLARVRAVENGFALIRAAKEGVVTASDGYGRTLFARTTASVPEVVGVVALAPGPGETIYVRAGDWFGNACIAGAALLLALFVIRTWQNR